MEQVISLNMRSRGSAETCLDIRKHNNGVGAISLMLCSQNKVLRLEQKLHEGCSLSESLFNSQHSCDFKGVSGGLNEKGPHRDICLNVWSTVGGFFVKD